ncbi:pyridoxamine 5'-phosphate oxidase family protein, partial [Desulfuromonas sp.]
MKAYFETSSGKGVLSTADGEGRVDAAIYAKPHVMDDGTLAFIMRDRLTHKNLTENPYAAYLFVEDGPGYRG